MTDKERQEVEALLAKGNFNNDRELKEYLDSIDWVEQAKHMPEVFNTVKRENVKHKLEPISEEFINELYQSLSVYLNDDLQVNRILRFRQR